MQCLLLLVAVSCSLAAVSAEPGYLAAAAAPAVLAATAPAVVAAPAAPAVVAAAAPAAVSVKVPTAAVIPPSVSTQYHAQDELGGYAYGYNGGPSAKEEIRAPDGSVVGAYSYVDVNGVVQSAQYASDPVNGFRVAATNLPVGPAAPAPAVVAAAPIVAAAAAPAVVAAGPAVVDARVAAAHLAAKSHLLGRKKRGILGVPGVVPYAAAPLGVVASAHAPAVVAAAPGSTVVTVPGTSAYSFSTTSLHPPQVVPASPQTAITAAYAVHPHLAAKAHLLGRKKRSPGYLGAHGIVAGAYGIPAGAAVVPTGPVVATAPGSTTITNPPFRSFSYAAAAGHPAQVVPNGPVDVYAAAAPVYAAGHAVAAAPAVAVAPAVATVPAAAYAAPAAYAAHAVAAPAAAAVLPVTASNQYRVQDGLGQYTYGYADGNSAKTESRAADGSTVGGYSYVDGHGLVQSVKYHADSLGFRVAATNLPVGHA